MRRSLRQRDLYLLLIGLTLFLFGLVTYQRGKYRDQKDDLLTPLPFSWTSLKMWTSFIVGTLIITRSKLPKTKKYRIFMTVMLIGFILAASFSTGYSNSTIINRVAMILTIITLGVISSSLWVIWILSKRNVKRMLLYTASVLVVLYIISLLLVNHASVQWVNGLWEGTKLERIHEKCNIQHHCAKPYRLLAPHRLLNIWFGPETCPAPGERSVWSQLTPWVAQWSFKPFARLEEGSGILSITCEPGELASYEVNTNWFNNLTRAQQTHALARFGRTPPDFPPHSNHTERILYAKPVIINQEWVTAFCGERDMLLTRVIPKKEEQAFNPYKLSSSNATVQEKNSKLPPDIAMIFLDAVSRVEFLHSMPLSTAFLQQIETQYDVKVFQFFRYMTVGTHTITNLTPLFTGKRNSDYNMLVKNNSLSERGFFWNRYRFDKLYSMLYVINLCEDYPHSMWKLPTNTSREEVWPFDNELVLPFCHPDYTPKGRIDKSLRGPYSMRRRCITGKYVHDYTLDHMRQFHEDRVYPYLPKFSLGVFHEGHEGSLDVLPTMDNSLAKHLQTLYSKKRDTITMLFADHGNHMSPFFYWTECGKTERSLPFLFFVIPNSFLNKHPHIEQNLLANEQQLFTAFDLYKTLNELVELLPSPPQDATSPSPPKSYQLTNDKFLQKLQQPGSAPCFAKSLFEPLPNRSCLQAGIPKNACVCDAEIYVGEEICNSTDPIVPLKGWQ